VEKAKKLIQENFSDKEITPSAFRKLLGTSRKYALPLLNYFDAIGITRRVGDIRYLR
jgi:selenocysteine-specific elongation factor